VGSHIDVAGGLAFQGLAYAADVGAEAIQVFVSNPRGWSPSAGDQAEDVALARHAAHAGLPVFVHAPYLVNLGSADQQTAALSAEAVRHTLDRSTRIGARGVVVHAGSASGWERVQLVHANDSAQPCGSRRDKHAAIGAGLIGLEPFRELLHHPMLAAVPFVVETPKAGHAGDVAVLKELRDSAARQQPRDVAAHLEGLGPSA
jgi:endonuclease IV